LAVQIVFDWKGYLVDTQTLINKSHQSARNNNLNPPPE